MDFSRLDWPSILVTALLSSIGVVGSMAIKQRIDRSLEERKVRWGRASWVHQRQIEALTKLFVGLNTMSGLLQSATRSSRFEGETTPEDYLRKWIAAGAETWSSYLEYKLLLDSAIVENIERLFRKFQEAGIAIGSARILREGQAIREAAEESKKSAEIAHELIPPLLLSIESEARRIIHEESQ